MNSTIFFQFMRTGTSFPSRFMEKPEKHLCVFLFVFQILSDVVVSRLFSGPNGAKLITLNHKRLDKVHHLSQKHNAWDFVLFATDKLALKSLNKLREKYTFFRKNNWEGGKNKTCWHQFLDGASGLQLKVGVGGGTQPTGETRCAKWQISQNQVIWCHLRLLEAPQIQIKIGAQKIKQKQGIWCLEGWRHISS